MLNNTDPPYKNFAETIPELSDEICCMQRSIQLIQCDVKIILQKMKDHEVSNRERGY